MLCIVCVGGNYDEIEDWLDYYFHIGTRFIFFLGEECPDERMTHIPYTKKLTTNGIFNVMNRLKKIYSITCYMNLSIGEYLTINPLYDNEKKAYNYFYWCKRSKSGFIKSYGSSRLCRFILDKDKSTKKVIPNITIQKIFPKINPLIPSIKDISNCILDSSLYTVEMVNDDFNIQKAHDIFRKNGFVIVKNAINKDRMKDVADTSNEIIQRYNKEIKKYYEDGTSFDVNDKCTEISCRPGDRIMVKTTTDEPFTHPELIAKPILIDLLKWNLDGSRIEVGTMAAISSLPRSNYQHWHKDVPAIFPKLQQETQLPAQGLITVFAVEDVPLNKGPTNFIPCSNILNGQKNTIQIDDWHVNNVSCKINGYCVPELERGDILMFDYRTMHRGGKNNSDDWRTIMYITYVNEWYVDHINFNTKQTKEFDFIDEKSKLLLSRIDNEKYVKNLEDSCNENNIPISESKYEHGGRHELIN